MTWNQWHICRISFVYLGSFADLQSSSAEIQGSFAEIQDSFAEIQGSFAEPPFCRDAGLFCRDTGLFCRDTGLFCVDTWLFCRAAFLQRYRAFFQTYCALLYRAHMSYVKCPSMSTNISETRREFAVASPPSCSFAEIQGRFPHILGLLYM